MITVRGLYIVGLSFDDVGWYDEQVYPFEVGRFPFHEPGRFEYLCGLSACRDPQTPRQHWPGAVQRSRNKERGPNLQIRRMLELETRLYFPRDQTCCLLLPVELSRRP